MDYKKLYFSLFGTLSDAVEALENGQISEAREMLIAAMQEAEERYLEEDE